MKVQVKLGIRKINTDWYRVSIERDKFDMDIRGVDIFRESPKDWWATIYRDAEDNLLVKPKSNIRYKCDFFENLRSAKLYAIDYAAYIKSGRTTNAPIKSDDKYD